jgi:DNA polymerase
VVCLGATAAQSVFGRLVRLGENRGTFQKTEWAPATFITIHPSAIFRHPDPAEREAEYRRFVDDLKLVRRKLRDLNG